MVELVEVVVGFVVVVLVVELVEVVVVFVVVLVVKLVEVVVGFAVVVLVVELVKVVVGLAVVLVVELVKVVVSFVVSLTAALSEVTVSPEETVVSPAVVAVVVIVVPEVVASADFPPNAFSIVFPSCAHQTASLPSLPFSAAATVPSANADSSQIETCSGTVTFPMAGIKVFLAQKQYVK